MRSKLSTGSEAKCGCQRVDCFVSVDWIVLLIEASTHHVASIHPDARQDATSKGAGNAGGSQKPKQRSLASRATVQTGAKYGKGRKDEMDPRYLEGGSFTAKAVSICLQWGCEH